MHARLRLCAVIAAALLALTACASDEKTPVITNAPPPPAPAALPGDWSESSLDVPTAGAATYAAPNNPKRLRAALILGSPDKAGEVAARELAVMLAHQGVASLRFDGPPQAQLDYQQSLDRAGRGLSALAEKSGLGDDRLLAVGHGAAAPLAMALGAGKSGRGQMPIALVEPVLARLPAGTPDPLQTAIALPRLKHNLISCSDADIAVDCTAVQDLADVMTGTHVNFVRLRGVNHALQEDESRDPAKYAATDLPFSATLNRSLGSWVSMQ
ncbi:hypothetical protein [Tsukamurella sp. 1534]|uniref:hypothetical protein n=1 Tax=Tsukamurella sp. 1534 TaxID=1151061 RepID=UPI0011D184DC|nr:hypothetical protein [Tsukamurella sp. 1534]